MARDPSKTEKATPKKRRDERKKGNILMSKEAVVVVSLIAGVYMLQLMIYSIAEKTADFMAFCFEVTQRPIGSVAGELPELIMQGIMVIVTTVLPVMAVVGLSSIVCTMFQTKMLFSTELIKPKFSKLNPINGLKKLFSLRSVMEALKGILKIIILLVIIYSSLSGMFLESSKYMYVDINTALGHLLEVAAGMLFKIIIAFTAITAADFLYERWEFEENMKMTKDEVKEEYKMLEGDPKIKGKRRQVQRQRAMERMMQQVPQADVVIRNPTHYAVALRYNPEKDSAPVVLAKGQDYLALRIVKVAEENGVAVMENVPLARALYAQTELDREIPPSLYNAVAEVLVFIFRLDNEKKLVK